MAINDHLKDIDFRSRSQRQTEALSDFVDWYKELSKRQTVSYDNQIQSQLTMLSAVLWYLLPEKEYRRLTRLP